MITTAAKPWHKYRGQPDWKDLEPGYAGSLDDEQVEFIQQHLHADPTLSYWWGWKPGMKRRAIEAIRRVAMHGDPENRSDNVKLVREAGRRPKEGNEEGKLSVSKVDTPVTTSTSTLGIQRELPLRTGRPKIHGLDREILRLDKQGLGCRGIAEALQADGVPISRATVARRLQELRG